MIGIDVAKDALTACRWDASGEDLVWEKSYPNTASGVEALLAEAPPEMAWVLEPTSRYGELAVALAQGAGRRVLLAPPAAAKHYLKSEHPRAKTDKVDARGLARYGNQAKLREYRLKPAPLQVLWQLLQMRCKLAHCLAALRQQAGILPEAAPTMEEAIRDFQRHLLRLTKEIERAGRKVELFPRLREVPGIGPVTAAALTVRLLSGEFAKASSFIAYMGLDLRVHESGTHKGKRGLTKRGDAQLRWLLYLAARATLRDSRAAAFQSYYARKVAEGWSKTGVICMLARKLARTAWAMAKSGEPYHPERVSAGAPAPA
jgi:transposase